MTFQRKKFSTLCKTLLGNIFLIIVCFSRANSIWNLDWLQSQLALKSNTNGINSTSRPKFSDINGRIKSFIDFNGDKFTDIIIYSEYESKIKVLLWNNTEHEFYYGPTIDFEAPIASILVADWTGNDRIELIVTFYLEQKSRGHKYNKLKLALFSYNPSIKEFEKIWSSKNDEYSIVDPLVFDINGDGMPDLLGESDLGRFVWVNKKMDYSAINNIDSEKTAFSRSPFKIHEWGSQVSEWIDQESSNYSYGRLVENHSSAFVDMDGDCRSDLVLEVYYEDFDENPQTHQIRKGLEIWTNEIIDNTSRFRRMVKRDDKLKGNKLNLILLPIGAQSISYSDFNRDGTTDLIVPVCQQNDQGCESKSRLVFIPNIHEYKDCVGTNQFGFPKYQVNDNKRGENYTVKCRSSTMFCSPSPFKIHSFTEEESLLIFQDLEVSDTKRNNAGFFSLLFGTRKENTQYSKGSLFQGFTVSVISENNHLIDYKHVNGNKTGQLQPEKSTPKSPQFSSFGNQMASFFSFLPNKDSDEETMQWSAVENGSVDVTVGDFNLDGYPDILAVLKFKNGTRQTRLIENFPMEVFPDTNRTIDIQNNSGLYTDNISQSISENKKKGNALLEKLVKTFKSALLWLSGLVINHEVVINGDPVYRRFAVSNLITTYTNFSVDYTAFYDFFEDGNLDIISVSFPENDGRCLVSLNFAPPENQNLFIKVSALKFPSISKSKTDSKRMGMPYYGATIKIRMTGLVGNAISMTATQMSCSTRAIQTPFVLFGLGKTNNYIEELYVGTNYINKQLLSGSYSTLNYGSLFSDGTLGWNIDDVQFSYSNIWTGIIPNTQVIAQINPVNYPPNWTLVLSVNPQKSIRGILVVSVLALIIIGIIILVLDRREKVEDLKEHQGFKKNFISA
ncbi:FG-GAP repeat family protein [Cryptosporidium felis]|nr:FG-GAP repeat family protein [Cryptosporidium felis]